LFICLAGLDENYIVIKIRVKNRNIQKEKSAGYRLVYQVELLTNVLLLTIYSKNIACALKLKLSDRFTIKIRNLIEIVLRLNAIVFRLISS